MRNRLMWATLFVATAFSGGCTTINNPVPEAIPVRRLPDELLHAPPCAPHCETTVHVNRPTTPSGGIVRTKGEIKAEDNAPPPVESAVPPLAYPASGCGSCAVFYTGGALGAGAYPLKHNLRVTEAIAVARGAIHPGFGRASATQITVVRRLSTGQQLSIRVDLNEALRDPRENIAIWPGDMILTSETACQTTCRVMGELFHASARLPLSVAVPGSLP